MYMYNVWGLYRAILPNIGEECEQEQQTGQDVSPAHNTRHLQHTEIVEISHVSYSSGEENTAGCPHGAHYVAMLQ